MGQLTTSLFLKSSKVVALCCDGKGRLTPSMQRRPRSELHMVP